MREDYYAFTYLYQLRRAYLFEQDYYGDDSDCDSEPNSEREAEREADEYEEYEKREAERQRIEEGGEPLPAAEVPEEATPAGEEGEED